MENPWKGLASYTEADIKQYKFCGRSKATGKLFTLITNNLISTLYGKTGSGKTSLLQAGLFPLFRQESFLPVMCRPSLHTEDGSIDEYLIRRVEDEAKAHNIAVTKSETPTDIVDDEPQYRLWKYFYGHVFSDEQGNLVFPIVVLDQFEEILINSRDEAIQLLRQLYYLVGDTLSLPEDCYANFRVSISLREDYLYLLEDAIEDGGFSILRDNRMRLSALTKEEAREIIDLGDDLFDNDCKNDVSDAIIKLSCNKRGHISTNMLSLICSQLFEIKDADADKDNLTLDDINHFGKETLQDFYLKCVSQVEPDTRSFIEERLVSNGRRSFMALREFKAAVSKKDFELLVSDRFKILQVVTAGETEGVELIHDTLAQAVDKVYRDNLEAEQRAAEQKKTAERKLHKKISLSSIAVESLICLVISCAWVVECLDANHGIASLLIGVVLCAFNLLSSISCFGNKRYSPIYLVLQLVINLSLLIWAFSAFDSDDITYAMLLGFLYLFFVPIINLIRLKGSEGNVRFSKTFRYIYLFEAFAANPELKKNVITIVSLALSLFAVFVSYYTLGSWILWVALPLSSFICGRFLLDVSLKEESQSSTRKVFSAGLLVLSFAFIIIQHLSENRELFTLCFMLASGVWTFACNFRKNGKIIRKLIGVLSVWVLCGFVLPIICLGYDPFAEGTLPRSLKQPEIICQGPYVPVISVRAKDGLYGLRERNSAVFLPNFKQIDSVRVVVDESKSVSDLSVYTRSGNYLWSESFHNRAIGQMLATRIAELEAEPVDEWNDESFEKERELAAAYRNAGQEDKAIPLEYDYFIKMMNRGLMADVLIPSRFRSEEKSFRDIMVVCSNQIEDPKYEGVYKKEFISTIDSGSLMKYYASEYARLLKDAGVNAYTDAESNFTLSQIADIGADKYHRLLETFREKKCPHGILVEVLSISEDMLFQTREGMGQFIVDSLFVNSYKDDHQGDYQYHLNLAWYNLFLQRYEMAEKEARASVECAPDIYITYTNLINSLYLQGEWDEAFKILKEHRYDVMGEVPGDVKRYFFPIAASSAQIHLGLGIVQDMNQFIRSGVVTDTTTCEFRTLRDSLDVEFNLPSDQLYYHYSGGWNLSIDEESGKAALFNDDGYVSPTFVEIDLDVKDSVAIIGFEDGCYRYLDLRSMSFIGDKYDYAWHFSDSLAAVMLDEKIGFVDYSGTFSIPCQFPCEDWLIKNHNMLAFKDGFCPVMNEESNYYPIGKDGFGYANEHFDSTFAFPYWRNCDEGMIILSNGLWNATDINGLIQEKLPFEFDDVIRDQPIYRHLVVNESDVLEKLPDIDISGVWWCETMESYVYFGKYDSCCVGADAFHFNGKYFIQQSLMEKTLILSDDADFYDFTISDYSDGYLELLESDGDKLIFYRQREL